MTHTPSRFIPSTLLFLIPIVSGCSVDTPAAPTESVASESQAIAGGSDDLGSPESDVVVMVEGQTIPGTDQHGLCTGTLITPKLVLTAKHCIRGDDQGFTGLIFPLKIRVGSRETHWTRTYPVSSVQQATTWGDDPNPAAHKGDDLAVLTLDTPAYEVENIYHPSLMSPGDGETLGMAGWAQADTNDYRQVAYQQDYDHDQGYPDFGQYWRHDQGAIQSNHGDSGGPLFFRRFVTTDKARGEGYWYRDVVGVLHGGEWRVCLSGKCWHDTWTDVTRGAPRDWLLNAVRDTTKHGPNWYVQHPTYQGWYGDVDYTGPCNTGADHDCDHWYNSHDNCPELANWEQADADDDGVGDVCPAGPKPVPSSLKWQHVSIPAGGNTGYVFPTTALAVGSRGSLNEYLCRIDGNAGPMLGSFDSSSTCVLPSGTGLGTVYTYNFDVAVYDGDIQTDRPTWVPSTDPSIPNIAYSPGKDAIGNAMHVCRAWSGTSQFPGMLTAAGCWIAVNNVMTKAANYEVLLLSPLPANAGTGLKLTLPGSISITQGHTAGTTASTSGAPGLLSFGTSALPNGLGFSFGTPAHVGDTMTSVNLSAASWTAPGTYPVTITATANNVPASQLMLVEVDACTLVTSCGGQCGSIPNGCGGTLDCGACPVCTTPQCKCEDTGGTWVNGKCRTCGTPAQCCVADGNTWHNGKCL